MYLNICSEPYSNTCLSFFDGKNKSRYNLCIQNIQYNILFRGSMSEPFFNFFSSISDEYEYLNNLIKVPSNIICIRICAVSGLQIY